ncbi:hypothetical protein J1605_019184 [Eschrichtius robustus]|uniref:Transcription initiation factor IIA subunit 1 n=1 Tax=Eschrichtius robustus TaxID=9764 RepID=A0AB34HNE9_ESCRO|nr:hypothetical protein J1605_019184 [Eschrichtius robustus]
MANSANTNTVVRTWFGGRRGLRSGGSNGRTGRGRGRPRLPASTLLSRPRGRRRHRRRRFPPQAERAGAPGGGRGGVPRLAAAAAGRAGAPAGPGAAAGRLGRGERAAPAPDPGRQEGGREGRRRFSPKRARPRRLEKGSRSSLKTETVFGELGESPGPTAIHFNAVKDKPTAARLRTVDDSGRSIMAAAAYPAFQSLSLPKLYRSVIEDVINDVRDIFLDDGVDEQVLMELKTLWENKLMQSRAVDGFHSEEQQLLLQVQQQQQPQQQQHHHHHHHQAQPQPTVPQQAQTQQVLIPASQQGEAG